MSSESLELEPSRSPLKTGRDVRPSLPEPPPVRLVAVEDVRLPAAAGVEVELDALYADVLQFQRERNPRGVVVYRADNFRLRFDVLEPPIHRDDFRLLFIEVPVLADIERKFIEREIEYERQRGLAPAHDQLVLLDPAGNWLSIGEMRTMR